MRGHEVFIRTRSAGRTAGRAAREFAICRAAIFTLLTSWRALQRRELITSLS